MNARESTEKLTFTDGKPTKSRKRPVTKKAKIQKGQQQHVGQFSPYQTTVNLQQQNQQQQAKFQNIQLDKVYGSFLIESNNTTVTNVKTEPNYYTTYTQQTPMSTNVQTMDINTSKSPNKDENSWYLNEIQSIMHGFGDCPNPNPESAWLIEQIVHQQMTYLLKLAGEVALIRQSKQIGLEEFLFLLRKDKVKLCRLLRHFSLKDARNKLNEDWSKPVTSIDNSNNLDTILDGGCTLDFDEEELLNALISEQKKTNENLSTISSNKSQTTDRTFPQPAKRLKLCADFLASIDQDGDLLNCLHDDHFYDELKYNRMLRIERITRFMSEEEYMRFYKARQTSFANRLQPNKFRDWLFSSSDILIADQFNKWPVKPNALAIEILQYFAYETVALIVDLALLVKQDQTAITSLDPVSGLITLNAHNSEYPILHTNGNYLNTETNKFNSNATKLNSNTLPSPFIFSKSSSLQSVQTDCPFFSIKPQEIREVIRRYINSRARGSICNVLLFGAEHWDRPLTSRCKVMCL